VFCAKAGLVMRILNCMWSAETEYRSIHKVMHSFEQALQPAEFTHCFLVGDPPNDFILQNAFSLYSSKKHTKNTLNNTIRLIYTTSDTWQYVNFHYLKFRLNMMKILFLVQKEQRAILDRLYEGVAAHSECNILWLSDKEQANLRKYFKENVDTDKYDRIMLFLRIKKEMKQVPFLRTIPNLVFLEHDACQNYMECKYKGRFSNYYSRLPWVRIIVSGATLAQRLQKEHFDAVFVSKAYDQTFLKNLHRTRDVELGFIGSLGSGAYSERKKFLEKLAQKESLLITRTNSGEDYLNMLNRIRFFVSCDMGMGEYMSKNFEALACGCVLITYSQGDEENKAIGFKDMENVVLYKTLDELQHKLSLLRLDKALAENIASKGQKLAEEYYNSDVVGKRIVEALIPDLRKQAEVGFWQQLRNRLGW